MDQKLPTTLDEAFPPRGPMTLDEAFPPRGPMTLDEAFPPEVEKSRYRQQTLGTSPIQDLIFGDTSVNPVARVLDHFRQGAAQTWGAADATRLSKESEDFLKTNKMFDAWNEGQGSIVKAANESLFRPAAVQMVKEIHDAEMLFRGVGAVFHGVQAAASQTGEELSGGYIDRGMQAIGLGGTAQLGHDVAGSVEALQTGLRQPTGVPHTPPHPMLAEIERARSLGVIGAGEEGYLGTKAPEVAPPISTAQELPKPVEPAPIAAPEPGLVVPVERAAPAVEVAGKAVDEGHPIAQDVARRLEHAGRPADEAIASGQVVASHYEARAARFGGELGTAEEIYKAEGARIRGPNGEAPEPVAAPQPRIILPGEGAAVERPNQSLLDFLAREGGLKPTADLKQIFGDENPVIPGAGRLFRKDGLTMDEALTRAKENSFVLDPNDIQHTSGAANERPNTIRWQDLQDMIAEEAAGNKQYRNTRRAEPAKIDKDEEFNHISNELHRQVEESGGDPRDIDPVTERRVVEMIQKGEAPDVMTAYEAAILEIEYNQHGLPEFNQAAYHGSPYDFEAFDTGKIGTGEGAQSYGHGLYFAENEGVARGYQKGVIDKKWFDETNARLSQIAKEMDAEKVPGSYDKFKTEKGRELKAEYDRLLQERAERKGNLYRVNIKPEPHEFLQWDKRLNEQTPEIQAKIKQAMGIDYYGKFDQAKADRMWKEHQSADAGTAIRKGFIASDDVLVSKRLAEAGIPGIRYLDAGSRLKRNLSDLETRLASEEASLAGFEKKGTWLQGPESFEKFLNGYRESIKDLKEQIADAKANPPTHNYVVFDPKSIEITDKNGKSVSQREFELDQIKRGKIRFPEGGKPIITLFKDANASTFIHETGHHWLEELMKDSEHPKAPEGLRADADAVLKWLKVDTYHDIKVRHHEQFARGFERYMMEGKAPSQGLAKVFASFKDWLTRIYQTVDRLKSPINDEIRGVFDRLLTMRKEDVKIEPEGPAKTFADIHEADAISTLPEHAHPVAETIQAERDMLANEHIPEDHDARLEGVTSKAGRREAGGPQPLRDGNEAGPGTAETPNNQGPGAVGEGGSVASPEGAGASVGGGKTEAPTSPQATFNGPESPLIDKAGNIRLDNLGTAEDVNKAIRDAAEQNNDFIEARRGVITDGQVLELADALGMDESKLSVRKLGQAFNAEQIMAARKLLIQSATTVRDAMVKASAGAEVDILAYAEAKARHQMIQEQVAGLTAEAGRALRAFRKLEGQQEAGAIGAFLKDATGKTLFQLQREAQLGMQLSTPADVSKFVNDSSKPTWKDMVIEAWISALLSGPKTHVANIMGNTISGLARPLETGLAAGIGKVRNLVTGTQDRVLPGEAAAELFGMVHGAREGVIAAAKAFKTEEPQLTPVNQTERGHVKALPSATVNILGREMEIGGKQARIPLRLLGAEDEVFKAITFRGDINRQAYALASKENLPPEQFSMRVAELSKSPTEEMVNKAKDAAEYQTFQTPLGKVGRSVQNFANSHILAKFVLPFVRTPINLLKYAGERTPLGLFSEGVRDNLSGKNGAVARDTQISRMALGTMVGIATYELASQGLITGGGPADKNKKAVMQANGWQDYSIRIGDMYYRYNRLDPFSVILGVVADAYEIYNASGSAHPDKEKIPSMVFAAVTQNILNRASLQGVSDLIQAVTDHERYGRNYIKKMAGTVVPAISSQMAQALDPVVREARTALDGIKARIPGLSQTLLPKRDVWGEPITREGGLGPDIASPIIEARMKNDPVNKALLDAGYYPGHLNRKIRGVELTDEQYDDYQRVAGRTAKTRLNAALNMISNPNIPATVRHDAIASIIKGSRETAQSLVIMQSINSENNIMKKATDAKVLKARGDTVH